MDYKIEKGIQIPLKSGRAGKYPWREMEVGDSFFVPDKPSGWAGSKAHEAGKRMAATFTTRRENGGYRFWRVA